MPDNDDKQQQPSSQTVGTTTTQVETDKKYSDPKKGSSTKPGTAADARIAEIERLEKVRTDAAAGKLAQSVEVV